MARVLIGRVAELHQLEANFRAARGGEFRLALLSGEAGIGKTRLLDEFLDRARADDVLVLAGACLPLESASLPYAPIADAFHELVHVTPPAQLDELLGPARPDLARLLPELEAEPPASPPSAEREARTRFFEQLLGFLERAAASRPIVLALEDVHWADVASRDLLRFLLRGLRRASVLTVLTMRTDEPGRGPGGRSFPAELARLPGAARIELSPFDEGEVRALATELIGAEPSSGLVRQLADRSDGIPFVIEQLVEADEVSGTVPPTLADTVRTRLGRLSAAGRTVLGIAAACGRRVDDSLVAVVSGFDANRVEQALAEAVRAGILVPVSVGGVMRYEFRHALLREAIDIGLHLADRKRVHRIAAETLDQLARDREMDREGTFAELAYHWEAAEEWDRAFAAHLEAAREADRLYAWSSAVLHAERALALTDRVDPIRAAGIGRPELLHRAADHAYFAGDYDQAIAWIREAIDLVGDDPPRAGAYHERLRWYLWDAGDRRGAMVSVEEALRLIPEDPPSRALASVLGQKAGVQMHSGMPDAATETATRALAVARDTGAVAEVGQALGILGWIHVVRGDVDEGLAALDEAVTSAFAARDMAGFALGNALIAHMRWWLGHDAEARDAAISGYDRIAEMGLHRTYGGLLLGHSARARINLGDWDDADADVARGLEHEPATGEAAAGAGRPGSGPQRRGGGRRSRGLGRPGHWPRINRARLRTLRAAWAEATEDLAEARTFETENGPTEYGMDLIAVEVEHAAWRGDLAAARAAVDQLAQLPSTAPFGPAHARAVSAGMMAEADEAERARESANTALEREAGERADQLAVVLHEAIARAPHLVEAPSWAALAGLVNAELARAIGTATVETWTDQAAAWEAAAHPLEALYASHHAARLLMADPVSRSEGHEIIERVRERAEALGAACLTDRLAPAAGSDHPDAVSGPTLLVTDVGRITVHALGRLRMERDGQQLRNLGGPKAGRRQAEALFAFLLDRGPRGVAKDEVIEMIWEEMDLEAADLAFHRTLGGLRRTLQPGLASLSDSAIRFDHDRYTLEPGIVSWTDYDAFEAAVDEASGGSDRFVKAMALEEAHRLYRGEYFDDCPFFGDSAEVEPTRDRLRQRYVNVLVMLGELAEERGDRHGADSAYRQAIEITGGQSADAAAGLARVSALGRDLRLAAG
jgi:DNA-binding SARP family transcriptional activator